jgi:hypothetical protein
LAQPVPARDLAAAIQAGQAGKVDTLRASCSAGPAAGAAVPETVERVRRDGVYAVSLFGSRGRVAVLAAEAKRRGQPYTVEDIPNELKTANVYVFVNPIRPSLVGDVVSAPSPIDKLAIRSKAEPNAQVVPEGVDWEGVEWRNPLGGFIEANRATASFPWSAVQALPAGDLEVVIFAEAGERGCTIGQADRRRVLATP